MPKVTEEAYLVRVNAGAFVVMIDGRTISTTTIPSAAAHMAYEVADRMVQFLRRRAYRFAVVTDYLGVPVSAIDLRSALVSAEMPLPKTLKELNAIPTAEQRQRFNNEPAFKKRWDQLHAPKAATR
jgi:hypothetical protein